MGEELRKERGAGKLSEPVLHRTSPGYTRAPFAEGRGARRREMWSSSASLRRRCVRYVLVGRRLREPDCRGPWPQCPNPVRRKRIRLSPAEEDAPASVRGPCRRRSCRAGPCCLFGVYPNLQICHESAFLDPVVRGSLRPRRRHAGLMRDQVSAVVRPPG